MLSVELRVMPCSAVGIEFWTMLMSSDWPAMIPVPLLYAAQILLKLTVTPADAVIDTPYSKSERGSVLPTTRMFDDVETVIPNVFESVLEETDIESDESTSTP